MPVWAISIIIALTIIVIAALVVFAYFNHGSAAPSRNDFAVFGSYAGGVITPAITLGTIIILLIQLSDLREQLKHQETSMAREFGLELEARHFKDFEKLLSTVLFESVNNGEKYQYTLANFAAIKASLAGMKFLRKINRF